MVDEVRGLGGSINRVEYDFVYLSDAEVHEALSIISPSTEDEYESVTARQVSFCYDLIAANRLVPGKTIKELAVVWGMGVASVKRHTAEAYRRFKADIQDPEEIRGAIIQRLDAVMSMAMNHKKPFLTKDGVIQYADDPNYGAAVSAAKEIKSLVGLDVKKIEHSRKEYDMADLPELLDEWRKHREGKTNNDRPEIDASKIRGALAGRRDGRGSGLFGEGGQPTISYDVQAEGTGSPEVGDPGD